MKFAADDGPMAIPLWINGRAYLTVTEEFLDVRNAASGEAVRRTPLSGADEVAEAVRAAQAALPAWQALDAAKRQAHLSQLARLLDQYTGHFAKLVRQETGFEEVQAQAEVATAVQALQDGETYSDAGVSVVLSDAMHPLAALAATLAAALRGGACVVVKPSPKAPGAAFALAELSGRAGLPPGVLNLVHGDLAAIEALCRHPDVGALRIRGETGFGAQVEALAKRCGGAIVVD